MNSKSRSISSFLLLSLPFLADASMEPERLACPALRCSDEIVNVKAQPFAARGDGIADDTAAIQAALDAARIVLVPPGTYLLSLDPTGVGLRLLQDDTSLILESGAVLLLRDSQILGGRDGQVLSVGDGGTPVHGITISGGGTLNGNRGHNTGNVEVSAGIKINAAASDVAIRGITIAEVTGDAVLMVGNPASRISRVLIEGAHVESCDEGVLFKYSDDVQILGSRFRNIDVQDAIEPHGHSEHWIIANNTIDTVPNGQGIDPFDGARYGVISNNSIHGAQQGMDLTSGGIFDPVTDLLVEGNLIAGSTRESIYLPGNDAKTDTRIVIRGNVIDSALMYGVYVGANLKGIRVEGNQITNTAGYKGVFADAGSQVDVLDNMISDTGLHGIHHRGSDSLIRGNVVKNSSRALPGEFPGIQLDGGARLTCVGNWTYDDQHAPTQFSGIWVRSSESLVEHNSGFGNIGGLITDERGAGTIIRENAGYATEASGTAVFSGDDVRKDFPVTHGLRCTPDVVLYSCKTIDAAGSSYWTSDSTSLVIHFAKAPRSGAGNVSFTWRATCP